MINTIDITTSVQQHRNEKQTVNADGGFNWWVIPANRQFYPFNPYKIKCSRWMYFVQGESEPDYPIAEMTIQNNKLAMQITSTVDLYVSVLTRLADNTEVTNVYRFPAGRTRRNAPEGETFLSIVGLSLANEQSIGSVVQDTAGVVFYVANTTPYASDELGLLKIGSDLIWQDFSILDTLSLDVRCNSRNEKVILNSTMSGGVAVFNISPIAKLMFPNELASLYISVTDERLCVPISVVFSDTIEYGEQTLSLYAVNGVGQVGELSYPSPNAHSLTFLSWSKLYKYAGFPIEESVIENNEITRYNRMNDRTEICTPAQPFYVRWINQFGGVEQFMFSVRQTRKEKVKNSSLAEVDVDRIEDVQTNEVVYDITIENTIEVGAVGISTEEDWKILRRLPFSPEIAFWNIERNRWVRLSVNKFDGEWNTDNGSHDITIEFNLPALYVQF